MIDGGLADASFDDNDGVAFDNNNIGFWEYDSYDGRGSDNIHSRPTNRKRKRKTNRSAAESDSIPNAHGGPAFTAAWLALFLFGCGHGPAR
jgi:hypothetical protein